VSGRAQWLQRIWYGGERAPWWLRALTPVYARLSDARGQWYARHGGRVVRLRVPVIVIGNITAGGTGKTPLVIWLATRLAALGLQVAVVSRGYGRRERGGVRRVELSDAAAQVGDEALLIRQRAGCPVYVARDRVAAARAAVAAGAGVVIADDGLQHLRLGRDCEIALLDAQRGLGSGELLPAGPLRERAARLATVNAVVLTGTAGSSAAAGTPGLAPDCEVGARAPVRMSLEAGALQPVARTPAGPAAPALAALAGQRVHAVAGIGNPNRFFAQLRAAGLDPLEHPFPDHHRYRRADLRFNDGLAVIMTEKDAVKCRTFAPANCWCLPVTARFEACDERRLLGRILMDARLLDILACPLCKGPVRMASDASGKVLVCRADRLAFPVRDDIPVMLEEEARLLGPTDPLLER